MEINEAYAICFMLVLLNFPASKIRSVWPQFTDPGNGTDIYHGNGITLYHRVIVRTKDAECEKEPCKL